MSIESPDATKWRRFTFTARWGLDQIEGFRPVPVHAVRTCLASVDHDDVVDDQRCRQEGQLDLAAVDPFVM